jgi:hypothetical protein
MPQLNFFATKPDLKQVFDFVYAETDFRVFESYSEFGRELREFSSLSALAAAYEVGADLHGNGTAALLQMWSPSVMAKPEIVRIALDPNKCKGHTFRYRISGYGLVQLYLGGIHGRIITHSHYGHFSERGAAKWGDISHVDWVALKKISGRFQRHVSRKLAVAKAPGNPVLADAFEKYREGYELRWAAQNPAVYEPIPLWC